MNQRNVDALTAILDDILRGTGANVFADNLAQRLTSRGVLVPSALTDEELEQIWEGGSNGYGKFRADGNTVQEMECIARGGQ